ncbi:MAG: acyl-CoA thioesterase II [Hyphomicrobiaceae bacterium]
MSERKPETLQSLLAVLELLSLGGDRFRADSLNKHWHRVYGGQVVAQAMVAAFRTVEGRIAHSLHAYFLRMGDPLAPIDFEVSRLRDGRAFSTRNVVASQGGEAIFTMSMSFHNGEEGIAHQSPMPGEPRPEELPDEYELERQLKARRPDAAKLITHMPPIEFRPINIERFLDPSPRPAEQNVWMRVSGRMPEDPKLHQIVLAYMSDYSLIDTALVGHGRVITDPTLQIASIDHALWFHRPGRVDDWLLYAQDSPSASGGRGFCRGSIFRRDGVLVASAAQEGLFRNRPPKPERKD